MNQRHMARKYASYWPVLQRGFRLFFLLAAVEAVMAMALWLLALAGWDVPGVADAPFRHRHEMIFGFAGAAVSGFLLTAVPNWTGRLPVAGPRLALLGALFIAGRVAILLPAPWWLAAGLDVVYWLLLGAIILREIFLGRNRRNYPIGGILALFALADLTMFLEAAGLLDTDIGARAGIALLVVLITIIGGRVTPSFTANRLRHRGVSPLPRQNVLIDRITILLTVLSVIAMVVDLSGPAVAALYALAALAHGLRLSGWRGTAALGEPILFILHVGYGWLVLGFLVQVLAALDIGFSPSTALHAFNTGAIGTMILAVSSRAILGHSGQDIVAAPLTVAAYVAVNLAAVVRLGAAWLPDPLIALAVAAGLWMAAFVFFLADYWRLLLIGRR